MLGSVHYSKNSFILFDPVILYESPLYEWESARDKETNSTNSLPKKIFYRKKNTCRRRYLMKKKRYKNCLNIFTVWGLIILSSVLFQKLPYLKIKIFQIMRIKPSFSVIIAFRTRAIITLHKSLSFLVFLYGHIKLIFKNRI